MANVSAIKAGQTVSFKLHTKLLKDEYQHVVVKGIVGYDIAISFEDVAVHHENIYSTLPQGTPRNPQDYEYLLVKTQSGETKAVGVPWIKDPVTVIESAIIRITVNQASVGDVETIKRALNSYGFTDFNIEVV